VLNNRPNDELVDVNSQRGGLAAFTEFDSADNGCSDAHVNITSDKFVSAKVKNLLNQATTSGSFATYTQPTVAALADGIPSASDEPPPVLSAVALRPTASDEMIIASPPNGKVVAPGGAIDVTITATSAFVSAIVVTPNQFTQVSAQPFRARVDIPATAIGPYTIGVLATTATGESATAEVTLSVTPNSLIASLIVPLEFVLRVGDTVKPHVSGVFADGVTRDLSRWTNVAFASSNPSVVSALPDGTLRAIGGGTARVTVSADSVSADVFINVQSIPRRETVNH
jgi:hypothetical protein